MNNIFSKTLFCIITSLIASTSLISQSQLIITLNNSSAENFDLSEIRSIKFSAQTMNLYKNDGLNYTYNISDILNYRFEGVNQLNNSKQSIGKLMISPNPTRDLTSISFSSNRSLKISVEILDLSGRFIQEVYSGLHVGTVEYSWQPNLEQGIYIVRIGSENGVINQLIIIQ